MKKTIILLISILALCGCEFGSKVEFEDKTKVSELEKSQTKLSEVEAIKSKIECAKIEIDLLMKVNGSNKKYADNREVLLKRHSEVVINRSDIVDPEVVEVAKNSIRIYELLSQIETCNKELQELSK